MKHHTTKRAKYKEPDMEETKEHIMKAGREILFAAQGALRFCKDYVESSVPKTSQSNLISFFQKAMAVADELGRGLSSISSVKTAAGKFAGPLFDAMETEMRKEHKRPARRKR